MDHTVNKKQHEKNSFPHPTYFSGYLIGFKWGSTIDASTLVVEPANAKFNRLTCKVKQHKNGKTYRFQFQFEIGFDPSLRFSFEVNPTLYWPSFRQNFGETLHTQKSLLVVVGTFPSKMELI